MIKRAEAFLKDYLMLLSLLDLLISEEFASFKSNFSKEIKLLLTTIDFLISKGFVKLDLSKEIELLESFLEEFKWVDEVR